MKIFKESPGKYRLEKDGVQAYFISKVASGYGAAPGWNVYAGELGPIKGFLDTVPTKKAALEMIEGMEGTQPPPPTRTTMKKINAAIRPWGIELVKGRGYFYFWTLPGDDARHPIDSAESTSVMTMHLTSATVEEWMADARRMIEEGLERGPWGIDFDTWEKAAPRPTGAPD